MIKAVDLDFDLNNDNFLITASHAPGQQIQMEVEDGNSVTLKKGDISIEVKEIKRNADGTFLGVIQYIDPYDALMKDGVEDGVEIVFLYRHIFACNQE